MGVFFARSGRYIFSFSIILFSKWRLQMPTTGVGAVNLRSKQSRFYLYLCQQPQGGLYPTCSHSQVAAGISSLSFVRVSTNTISSEFLVHGNFKHTQFS